MLFCVIKHIFLQFGVCKIPSQSEENNSLFDSTVQLEENISSFLGAPSQIDWELLHQIKYSTVCSCQDRSDKCGDVKPCQHIDLGNPSVGWPLWTT